ncbi:glycoside hydrolase family 108 protein [Methylocella silvestris]|uniref:TtsA-like Glycoside hydrolase family 108 domain-containing protein n=1 Tax=Methylocella silvestris TaxID=199596 RepID=A0A2J7TJQ4_METSI|nr:glycosyl hydrolase 108 family protein [Methylocella silvestris]PNG26995.1 hypothetical protein CR492_04645 [Methylocella silvestris]
MANGKFLTCLPYTLREEGGYSNDPRDPGGSTYKGVTQARYDQFRKSAGLPKRDVRLMSETELQTLYRSGYWDMVGAETLADGVDLSAFDLAVNSGPARAMAILRKAIGGSTGDTIGKIADLRLSFLHGLSTSAAFGKGWGARVARIEAASLKMAGLPIQPSAYAAASKAKAKAKLAKGGAAAVPASAAGAHVAGGHAWLTVAIIVVILAAAGVAAYAAWRQRQRADELAKAAADLAQQTAATEATRAAAAAQAVAKTPVKS